ncbi:MAG: acetylglutamate kinase [Armatimonadota bacterium]|nr:acetylglutamate kinase [Armatimonadota bacterium]
MTDMGLNPEQRRLQERAMVLIEALPYITRYSGKTIVVKYGGNAMLDTALKAAVTQDIVLMRAVGFRPILVHGGGPEISELMRRVGKQPQFVDGLRVTDRETVELVEMVLVGKVNTSIVSLINQQGGRAVGLSGKDARLIVAAKREEESGVDLGFVGEVQQVNAEVLTTLSEDGYIPVVSSVGAGLDGESYNINADHVAGEIAAALNASKLIMLTDVAGVMRDPHDPSSLLSEIDLNEARRLIETGVAERGMIPKVEACITAVEAGVARAHIIDGRIPHSVLMEVFTDHGVGTMVVPNRS